MPLDATGIGGNRAANGCVWFCHDGERHGLELEDVARGESVVWEVLGGRDSIVCLRFGWVVFEWIGMEEESTERSERASKSAGREGDSVLLLGIH